MQRRQPSTRAARLLAGIALLSSSLSGIARAQEPTPAEIEAELAVARSHRDAGIAHVKGEPGGDPDGFAKCAAYFIELYNRYEKYDRPDELLWAAADCSDAAGQFGQAVQLRTALIERYPNSELFRDSLFYLAEMHEAIAEYEKAAARYEQFAKHFDKDQRTPDALQNVYLFRIGLDQREQAMQALAEYEQLYKKKDIARAAKIFWTRQALLDSQTAKREHAEEYLKTYSTKGGLDRAVVAEAVIAQDDWQRSCREPLLHDSCVTVERVRMHPSVAALAKTGLVAKPEADTKPTRYRAPKRCGSPVRAITTVHARSTKLSEQAQARFKKITKMVDRGPIEIPEDDRARVENFRHAWALALVYRADARFEEYLKLEPPGEESKQLLYEFFERKMKLGRELQHEYAMVKGTGSPHGVLAAAARTAMVLQSFADQLRYAKVPRELRGEAQVEAFCEARAELADSLAEQAIGAWSYCVERSTEFQYFTEFSRLCEAELSQLEPLRYPQTHELFGEPVYAGGRIEPSGLLSEAQAKKLGLPVE